MLLRTWGTGLVEIVAVAPAPAVAEVSLSGIIAARDGLTLPGAAPNWAVTLVASRPVTRSVAGTAPRDAIAEVATWTAA